MELILFDFIKINQDNMTKHPYIIEEVANMYTIEKVHERLMRSELSEYDADMLIVDLLVEEAEDFIIRSKRSTKI